MENKLNIQITVTDEQMCSLLRGSLESLPDEKVQDIFSNALSEFFKTENGQRLFYTKRFYGAEPQPTPLLTKMVENAISKDLLSQCVDEFVITLKDNYSDILKSAMVQTFSKMFFSEMRQADLEETLMRMNAEISRKEDKRDDR